MNVNQPPEPTRSCLRFSGKNVSEINMKTLIQALMFTLLLEILTGCAYVKDSHLYSVRSSSGNDRTQQIAKVVESHLTSNGLILKTKYHDTYPEDIVVSVFEIPRLPTEKRRHPEIIQFIRSGKTIQLKHSEYWLNSSSRPRDYIKDIAAEIVSAVKSELGLNIELAIDKEDIYK
jgi:hypothetical protein